MYCKNVPQTLAIIISSRLASLHELDSVLSLRDMWDLLEILYVDRHNETIIKNGGK